MVEIVSDFKNYKEPKWLRRTVEGLLSSLPDGYCAGLSSIVLSELAVVKARQTQRSARRNRRGTPLGRYHPAWKDHPAWVELVVDEILTQVPRPMLRIQVVRDLYVGRVLFHEIGHHLDATIGSVGRTGEHGAEAWKDRLSRRHFRRRHGYLRYLRPVVRVIRVVRRRVRWLARRAKRQAG